jgi:hypothetical protein
MPRAVNGRGLTFAEVARMAAEFPGVVESMSYRTASLDVGSKLMARIWEDGETLVLKVPFLVQEFLLRSRPEGFFLTDHYRGYPAILVRLGRVDRGQLRELIEEAWRQVATKRVQATYDAGAGSPSGDAPRHVRGRPRPGHITQQRVIGSESHGHR